jgi:hypothetical protein
MSFVPDSSVGAGAAWCLRFVERRCGSFVWAALTDEGKQGEAEDATGAPVLSLATADLGERAQDTAQYEHLAVFALGIQAPSSMPEHRVAVRFVAPGAMRSAGRGHGSRWLVNDITIPTPEGLEIVSFLLYRVRRTPRLERVLALFEKAVETAECVGDADNPVLARAALEQLELLDEAEDAEVALSGRGLRFGSTEPSGGERHLAVLTTGPENTGAGNLWLIERKLYEGSDRASARPVGGRPYVLVRFGAPPTRQSVREFIEEIRRRHQRLPGQPATGTEGESFANFVDRQVDKRRQELIQATFGHHKMYPVVTPINLEAAADLSDTVALTDDPPSPFKQLIGAMRAAVKSTFGIPVPGLRVRLNESDMPPGSYLVMLDEIPLVMGTVDPKKLFCFGDHDEVRNAGFPNEVHEKLESGTPPDGSGRTAWWVPAERGEALRKAGFEIWDAAAYIIAHLCSVVSANLEMFVTLDDVQKLLSEADGSGGLFERVQKAPGGIPRFVEALRSLLMEGIPIKPISLLAERFIAIAEGLTADLAEELRRIPPVHEYLTRGVADWRLFVLAESYEAKVRESTHREGDAAMLALEPDLTQEMLSAVRQEIGSDPDFKQQVLVVEDWRLRPFVRSLLVLEFPRVRVVARREIEHLSKLPSPAVTISLEP